MESSQISAIAAAVIVPLVLGLLHMISQNPAAIAPDTGDIVLDYHPVFKILGIGTAVAGVGMGLLMLAVIPIRDVTEAFMAAGLIGFFALAGVLLALEMRVRVELTEAGIRTRTPWRGERFIRWDEISGVTFSPSMNWFVVAAGRGEIIRVSGMLRGTPVFARTLLCQVPADKLTKVKSVLEATGRN